MAGRFDELSRAMAGSTSRRGVLKMLGVAVAGAAGATVLKPFRAQAAVCPPGVAPCGVGCCQKKESCSDPATACCCPAGTTPCGTSCCKGGVACTDAKTGTCGCPAGRTPCGTGVNLTCCTAGKPCGDPSCQSALGNTVVKNCTLLCESNIFTDTFQSDTAGVCRQTLNNWNIGNGGNVDVVSSFPGTGGQAVDLDGSENACPGSTGVPPISLKTPIPVVAGRTYTASFRIGTNPSPFLPGGVSLRPPGNPDVNTVSVIFGPASATFTKKPTDGFTTETVRFVATANGNAQLTFQMVGPQDRGGIILDDVLISESCP